MIRLTLSFGGVTIIDAEMFTQVDEEEPPTTVIALGGDFTQAGEPEPEYYFTDDPDDRFGF